MRQTSHDGRRGGHRLSRPTGSSPRCLLAVLGAMITAGLIPSASTALADPTTSNQAADIRSGDCLTTDRNAVAVVIDYQGLGKPTEVYCVSQLGEGLTGQDLLAMVASVAFTSDGMPFVCRIDGQPSADRSMTLSNGRQYTESCSDTPPAGAYWGYWWAEQGGAWDYATEGAGSRPVVFGSYEGWSFTLGFDGADASSPRIQPARWAETTGESPVASPSVSTGPSSADAASSTAELGYIDKFVPGSGTIIGVVVIVACFVVLILIAARRGKRTKL